MVIIYKFSNNAYVYNRLLNSELVEVLLEFIDEGDFELKGEFFECFMDEDEVKALLSILEQESHYYYQDAKLSDYDFEVAKSYTKRMNAIDELQYEFEQICNKGKELEYFIVAIDKEHLALQSTIDTKLVEAVVQLQQLSNTQTSITYVHDIDLPAIVDANFFDDLKINWSWGIGIIQKADELLANKYIPLKGYQVAITTEIKQYFTNAFEVTYTAYHIYRNAKDHRYQYKQKRAQRSYRFIVDEKKAIEVNHSNEQQYNRRVEEANNLQSLFNKKAEQSLKKLFEINQIIQTTFNKNAHYYEKMMQLINDFLENDYLTIIHVYFLLGHMTSEEYDYHFYLIFKLKEQINEISLLQSLDEANSEILTRQAALLKAFVTSTEIAPTGGILEVQQSIVQRTLMQIEEERGYSELYRSDDSLEQFYNQQLH